MPDPTTDTPAQDTAPPADVQAAVGRRGELMADAEWRSRYLAGGAAERAEMAQLNTTIVGPAVVTGPVVDPSEVEHVRAMGVEDERIVAQIGQPVSRFEFDAVTRWKRSHLQDPTFRAKLMSGDWEARRKMTICNIILSSPVKEG